MLSKRLGISLSHDSAFNELFNGSCHLRIRNARAHLQRLDEKLRFDNSPLSGFEIELIGSAAAVAPDALQHRIDLNAQIRTLAGGAPNTLREVHEFILQRTGNRPGAGQGLRFPQLGARLIVSFLGRERAAENSLLSVGM